MTSDATNLISFPDRLRQALTESSMKHRDFAETLGVSRSTVSRWVSGKSRPSAYALHGIASILGKSSDYWALPVASNDTVATSTSNNNNLTAKEAKRIIRTIHVQKFVSVQQELAKFTGNDDQRATNYETLPISCTQLELVKLSLSFLIISRDIPVWSDGMLHHINGAIAVLNSLQGLIPAPLIKSWNSMMEGLKLPNDD